MYCKLLNKLLPIILIYSSHYEAISASGTKIIQQIKDTLYDVLNEAKVITSESASFASIHDAVGFTPLDVSTGGSIKTRLENLTTVVAGDSCKLSQLQTRLDQYNVERRTDMNTLVTLQAQIMEQNRRTESLLLSIAHHVLFFLDNETHGVEDLLFEIRATQRGILLEHVDEIKHLDPIYSGKQLKEPKSHHSCYGQEKQRHGDTAHGDTAHGDTAHDERDPDDIEDGV
jgi:hypothetical protein